MKIVIGIIAFMSLTLGILADIGAANLASKIYSGSFYVIFMIGMCSIYIVETVTAEAEKKDKKKK